MLLYLNIKFQTSIYGFWIEFVLEWIERLKSTHNFFIGNVAKFYQFRGKKKKDPMFTGSIQERVLKSNKNNTNPQTP